MGGGTGSDGARDTGVGTGTGLDLTVMSVEYICRECPVGQTRCRFSPKDTACVFHLSYGRFHYGPDIVGDLSKYSTSQLLRCVAF